MGRVAVAAFGPEHGHVVARHFQRRLDQLQQTAPIAFRPQNAGAYQIPELTLHPDIAAGRQGFAAHLL